MSDNLERDRPDTGDTSFLAYARYAVGVFFFLGVLTSALVLGTGLVSVILGDPAPPFIETVLWLAAFPVLGALIGLIAAVVGAVCDKVGSAPMKRYRAARLVSVAERRRKKGRWGTDSEALEALDAAAVARLTSLVAGKRHPGVPVVLVGRAGYETVEEGSSSGAWWQQLLAPLVVQSSTPHAREIEVRDAFELGTNGERRPRPDLSGRRSLAATKGPEARMRRGEDVVVVCVGRKPGEWEDFRLVGRLRDMTAPASTSN